MKKMLALIPALTLTLACFAGCGQGNASAASASSGSAEAPTAPPIETPAAEVSEAETTSALEESTAPEEAAEPTADFVEYALPITDGSVTYTLFEGVNPNVSSYISGFEENRVIQEWQNRTGISLDVISVHPSAASENFNILLAAGDLPSITSSGLSYYTGSKSAAVEEDIFADLMAYADSCPNYMATLEQRDGAVRALTTDEGYIPAFYQIVDNAFPKEGLVIRQDWLDQVDMEVPETYDQLYDVLSAFHTQLGIDAPMMMRSSGAWNYGVFSWGYDINGYMTTNPLVSLPLSVVDGEVKFAMMEDSYRDYISMLAEWFSEGLIYHDLENITMYAGYTNQVLNDEVGFFYTNVDMLPIYQEGAVSSSFALTAMESPKLNADDELHYTSVIPYSSTSCWTISAEAEDLETLITCVDYLYSPEGTILANYGVEGESYTLNSDGKPEFTDLITANPDGMGMDSAIYIYALQNGAFCEDYNRYANLTEAGKAMVDTWRSEPAESHVFPEKNVSLSTQESETTSRILGDVSAYVAENILKFIKGSCSMDEFDEFRQQLKDFGIDEYISIYQAAYDRYLER